MLSKRETLHQEIAWNCTNSRLRPSQGHSSKPGLVVPGRQCDAFNEHPQNLPTPVTSDCVCRDEWAISNCKGSSAVPAKFKGSRILCCTGLQKESADICGLLAFHHGKATFDAFFNVRISEVTMMDTQWRIDFWYALWYYVNLCIVVSNMSLIRLKRSKLVADQI